MTHDFRQDFIESLEKEGYKYLIITFKDLDEGAHISSDLGNLNEELVFENGRKLTQRESLIELTSDILNEVL